MYSYDDRTRAVELYIKLGKRAAATVRQLGYPTKNALKSWHREFEQRHDLPLGYVRSKSKYSDEQKGLAVEHYLAHDRCIAATRKALGYPCRQTLADWAWFRAGFHFRERLRGSMRQDGCERRGFGRAAWRHCRVWQPSRVQRFPP